jgi:hypothetical protein
MNNNKYFCVFAFATIVLLLFAVAPIFAQFDTLYAKKYPDRFGFSLFQSKPSYQITIDQKLNRDTTGDSKMQYNTTAKNVTGFGIFYDKISLFIGFKTPVDRLDQARTGKTLYSQYALAVTGVKVRMEASYRTYRGFYDLNSVNYIPDFTDSTAYYRNGEMRNHSLRLKMFYFLNKKKRFSYGAAYVNNVRQLRSAGSFIISGNLYNYSINSSGIVPEYIQNYYTPWQSWNSFNVTALTAGIGYTHTFTVFKRAFLNLLLTLGAEEQHVRAKSIETGQDYNVWRAQLSAYDLRSSLGFNSKGFFMSIQNIIDGNNYRLPLFDVSNVYISTLFNIGYRFPVKTPPFYKKIQEGKLYKAI